VEPAAILELLNPLTRFSFDMKAAHALVVHVMTGASPQGTPAFAFDDTDLPSGGHFSSSRHASFFFRYSDASTAA